jgi:glucokinase
MAGTASAVLAVDIGGTKVAAAVADAAGAILWRADRPVRGPAGALTVAALAALAADLGERAREAGRPVAAAAIALPAALDAARRRILYAPNLPEWDGAAVADPVEAALGAPVRLLYDGHAALLGEQAFGAARGVDEVVLLALGTGVGGAAISGGRLLVGADGLAGAAGWMPVCADGRAVPLEQAVAGPALARRGAAFLPEGGTAADLLALAAHGHGPAQALMARVEAELAEAVAGIVSFLNPRLVLFVGGVGAALGPHLPAIAAAVRRAAQPSAGRTVRLALGALGPDATLFGAVAAALGLPAAAGV